MTTETVSFSAEDMTYLRHGGRALALRFFRPAGPGPFPAVVDLHGGAWSAGDRTACAERDAVLAEAGLAVAALDFRQADDGYPSSLVDINHGIRWLKAHAADLDVDADRVGLLGQSSGGHLAMLAAMRPRDPRYAALGVEGGSATLDARVRCVGLLWPVINPLSRYRHALRLRDGANPPDWSRSIPDRHDVYWQTEDTMAEGNPLLALERGEAVETPPALWVQGRPDAMHDYRDPDSGSDLNEPERFVGLYRRAGGTIDLLEVEQATRSGPAGAEALAAFFKRHLAV